VRAGGEVSRRAGRGDKGAKRDRDEEEREI